jgi:hypothetical protein
MNRDPIPPAFQSAPANHPETRRRNTTGLLVALILIVFIIGGGALFYIHRQGLPTSIILDGQSVGTFENYQAAEAALLAAEEQKCHGEFPADSFIRLQKVALLRMPSGSLIDDNSTAISHLAKALKIHVRAYVITVNGKPTIGLPTSEAAGQSLLMLKNHFAGMPPNVPTVGEPDFVEKVVIERLAISPSETSPSANAAALYFSTPSPLRTYMVKPHETGFAIAHKNHIPFGEFLAANRDRNIDRLHPGDTVNLERPRMKITVRVKKEIGETEKIIANVPDDLAGKRHVTYLVTYENGQEASRLATHVTTIARPTPRRTL